MGTYKNEAIDNVFGSDAEFRAFCQAYEAALLASGFLEVAPDTGQLDLTTMVRPAANSFLAGFRMYRAKDSLSATRPMYIKLEFGLATGTIAGPMVRRTTATGSNGTGTLTGPTLPASIVVSPASIGSGSSALYGGGGPHSAFVYFLDPGNTSHQSLWVTGRLLDQDDGSSTDALLWDAFTAAGTAAINAMSYNDGGSSWIGGSFGSVFPAVAEALHTGGNISNSLVFQGMVYRNANTLVFPFLTGKTAELPFTNPDDSKFALNIWGGSHTFLPIPQLAVGAQRFAFLWEA